MEPAEQLALWADRLRDMAILGLRFAPAEADRQRYHALAETALELWAAATGRSSNEINRHRDAFFALPTPHPRAQAVILHEESVWLLPHPAEKESWRLPQALYRLPDDAPAAGLTRVVAEQTGLNVEPTVLTGLYDSPPRRGRQAYHAYDYVFAARLIGGTPLNGARRFGMDRLPAMPEYQRRRLEHALAVLGGDAAAHFDFSGEMMA
jgi:ADP-ribose pyrophosphatase YjhB (NUDIX family)